MEPYVCLVCGYVYHPDRGDPDGGIRAGTAFSDLAADWTCPICQAPKEKFEASDNYIFGN
jgi:rubredoxin